MSSSNKEQETAAPPPKKQKVGSSDGCTNTTTDYSFNPSNECPVCSEQLFDKNGVGAKAVAEMMCDHLVHSDCLAQVGRDLNSDGKRYGVGGFGPRAGCPVCDKPISMWQAFDNACQFKGFWTQRIENALRELGSAAGETVSGESLRSKLKEDPKLTKKQKKMIGIERESGFYKCLQVGGRVDFNHANVYFAGFLYSRGKWKYDSSDDTVWYWEWGLQTPSSTCANCRRQQPAVLTVCADCKDSSKAPMYCSDECQKSHKRYHSKDCGVFQVMKLGQEQGCTREELLERLRERRL